MKALVSLEQRFHRTPDGAVWSDGTSLSRFWDRYLQIFDGVSVVARLNDVKRPSDRYVRVDCPGVSFLEVPYYVGPTQYGTRLLRVRNAIESLDCSNSAVIMRVPSLLATHLSRKLRRTGQPFGVEVVGDPFDVFAPGAISHPLRPLFRWIFSRQLREQCRSASAAAYVTRYTLQRRYPCRAVSVGISDVELASKDTLGTDVLSTHFSSVGLDAKAFALNPIADRSLNRIKLLTIGSLEQPYKGVQHLISAVDICCRQGLDASLTVVGDGRYRPTLTKQVTALGLEDRVKFVGTLPAGERVRAEIDRSDLFVLASLTEGLPRVIIEAMARARPCIATSVGGIPELLAPQDIVQPADPEALAAKILEVSSNPERMAEMAARNLAVAYEFDDSVLTRRRNAFYSHLRDVTRHWRATKLPCRYGTALPVETHACQCTAGFSQEEP